MATAPHSLDEKRLLIVQFVGAAAQHVLGEESRNAHHGLLLADLLVGQHKMFKSLRLHHAVQLAFHLSAQAPAAEDLLDLNNAHFSSLEVVCVVRTHSVASVVALDSQNG